MKLSERENLLRGLFVASVIEHEELRARNLLDIPLELDFGCKLLLVNLRDVHETPQGHVAVHGRLLLAEHDNFVVYEEGNVILLPRVENAVDVHVLERRRLEREVRAVERVVQVEEILLSDARTEASISP